MHGEWKDQTAKVRYAYIGVAIFIVGWVSLSYHYGSPFFPDWDDIGYILFVALVVVFLASFLTLSFSWSYRHGRSRPFEGTFQEIGERLEAFLVDLDIEYDVKVKHRLMHDGETRTPTYGGMAVYKFTIDDRAVKIILNGMTESEPTWMAIDPWMGENAEFMAFMDRLDEAFEDVAQNWHRYD